MAKPNKASRSGSGSITEFRPGITGQIKQLPPPDLGRVVFCFKYLDAATKTFRLDQLPKNFGRLLLERFCEYGKMRFVDFAPHTGNDGLHSHTANPTLIEAHGGFKAVPSDLWQERPWQFMIQGKMRVVGFLLGSIFHIVWIDPEHKFDPRK